MSFRTQNFTIVWCDKCHEKTVLEPHITFDTLKCKCEDAHEEINDRADNQAKRSRKKAQGSMENAS